MGIIYAVNGSPRKNMNTAALLKSFLDGAKAAGCETKLINLYDYNVTGCRACGCCKLLGGASYGKCAIKDDISPIIEEICGADAVMFGSPIFFGGVTGEMHSFLERLFYPYCAFLKESRNVPTKPVKTAFAFTMNADEATAQRLNYPIILAPLQSTAKRVFTYEPEVIYSYFTYQYGDYGKYACSMWDEEKKRAYRSEHFPEDLRRAFDLGKKYGESCGVSLDSGN